MVESNADGDDAWESGTDALVAAATRDDVDIVLNAIVGAAGLDATLAALQSGKACRPREQGNTGRSPAISCAMPARRGRRSRSRRQRAQRDSSVHHRPSCVCRCGGSFLPRRAGRFATGVRNSSRRRQSRMRCVIRPGDGPQDHDRQRHAGQQGARSDRSPFSLRAAVRPDRGRGSSAEHRAFVRRVHRRQRGRPDERPDHGASGAVRAYASRPGRRRWCSSVRSC